MNSNFGKWALAAAAIALLPVAVYAQARDPAYDAARKAGVVGEKADGYLGFVSAPSGAVKALVDDLNIKRKALYTKRASEQNATVEQYAFTSGCDLVLRTVAGEKYQAPDGSWQTRGGSAPMRDSRCP